MIEEKYILELLKNFASTAEGKKVIKDKYGIDYDPKKDKGSTLHKWGDKMKSILYKHIKPVIKSISDKDIFVGTPIKDKNGKYTITISFNEDALFRQSLNPDGKWKEGNNVVRRDGKAGIRDIVLHFSYGWNAQGSVYGEWHGNDIWSLRKRNPNDFLEIAVEEFNKKAKNIATAELMGEYRK